MFFEDILSIGVWYFGVRFYDKKFREFIYLCNTDEKIKQYKFYIGYMISANCILEGEKMTNYLLKWVNGLTCDGEKVYFITAYISAIMVYDCRNRNVEILGNFPKRAQLVVAFEKIIKYNRKIYLFPCYAEDIYCYNLDNDRYYELNILSLLIDRMDKRKILEVLEYNGKIYCICRHPNMIICIDPETDDFQIYMLPQDLLKEEKSLDKTFFSVAIKDDHLIFPYMDNAIIEFSLEQKIYEVTYLNETFNDPNDNMHNDISTICVDNQGVIWMCDVRGQVFKVVNNKKIKINMPDDFIRIYNDGYHEHTGINRMFMVGNDLCFIVYSACKILKYSIDTQKFLWCDNDLSEWSDKGSQVVFLYTQIDSETYWIYSRSDEAIYKWHHENGFIEKAELVVSIDTLINSKLERTSLLDIFEKETDLSGYILYIQCAYENSIENMKCGEKIYYDLVWNDRKIKYKERNTIEQVLKI